MLALRTVDNGRWLQEVYSLQRPAEAADKWIGAFIRGEEVACQSVSRPAAGAAPAKGDALVLEQRSVNGHGQGAVPPGDGNASDPLYEKAVTLVGTNQRASISLCSGTWLLATTGRRG